MIKLRTRAVAAEQLDRGFKQPKAQAAETEVKVRVAKQVKYCYAFQKGTCTRNDCPFTHEINKNASKKQVQPQAQAQAPKPSTKKAPTSKQCNKCGKMHKQSECKFKGECNHCHKQGHKEEVCRSKSKAQATVVIEEDDAIARICQVMMSAKRNARRKWR